MKQELRRSPRRLRRCEHCIWTDLVGWDLQSFWKAYFLQCSLGKTKDSSRFGELSMRGAHNKIFDRIWNQTLFHCQSCWCFTVYACMTSTSDFVEYANEWASVRIHFWLALRFLKKINEMTWFIVHCFERRESWNEVYMFWICLSARKSSLTTRLFPGARRVKFPGLEPGLSAQRAMGLPQTNCSSYLFLAN